MMLKTKNFLGHPAGLYVLCGTEMWERLSYYGMSAIFVLYLTDSLTVSAMGWNSLSPADLQNKALNILGWYLMLIYITPIFGGYIADRFLGQRRSITIGGIMMMVGKFTLAVPFSMIPDYTHAFLYTGMALSILGNGLFKPNISTMVGELYPLHDTRRDSAFTIFYMGINFGALLAFLIVGYVGEKHGFHLAFFITGVGMLLGVLMQFFYADKTLGDIGVLPKTGLLSEKVNYFEYFKKLSPEELKNIGKISIFSALSVVFWLGFEQSSSSLTLFAKEKTDLFILGYEIPASWLRVFNPLFVFLCAPLMTILWTRMRDKQPDAYGKYVIGFLLLGITFLFPAAAAYWVDADATLKAPMIMLIMTYFFMTLAELCISPVGLSVVSTYAPARILGFMMGVWFLATSLGGKLSTYLSSFIADWGYMSVFIHTSILCFIFAFIVFVIKEINN